MNPSWKFPYPSQRMPVFARNMVTTSQPLAAQAGLEMLRRGGNAVDAAIATAAALTVVEPTSNGIGSDAFMLLWDGTTLHGLNASGRSPAAWTRSQFTGLDRIPKLGWDSATVPGCISAWVAASERFGKLPFAQLLQPAIHYAEQGFAVSPITAHAWAEGLTERMKFPEFARIFAPNGVAPQPGETVRFPDHSKTLRLIASSKGESFYRGDFANAVEKAALADGGLMRAADLAAHQCDWVTPVSTNYGGYTFHEIPPNGQGIATLMGLRLLEKTNLRATEVDTVESIHLQIEAIKRALSMAYGHVSDPATMRIDTDELLSDASLAARVPPITGAAWNPGDQSLQRGGTVLLNAADAGGMMVSFIQSNFWGFGSGIVVPGTGVALQNRGYGFTLVPGHPNEVAGGKRPFHTIIPGFATRDGNPVMAYGMMGGAMQAQGHLQLAVRMTDYNQNPQAASDAPRWQVFEGRRVGVEHGMNPTVVEALAARGHQIEWMHARNFGGAQLILRMADGGYCAGSDHRKDGQAVGF